MNPCHGCGARPVPAHTLQHPLLQGTSQTLSRALGEAAAVGTPQGWTPQGSAHSGTVCVCVPRPVRLLALVPAFTRVCVSPACPPGSDCLTRPPCCSCRARRLFPLPNLARARGVRGGGSGPGAAGGEPEVCSTRNDVKAGAGCPARHKAPQEPERLPLPPGFLRSSAAPGGAGSGQPPQPHTGPPGCSPREELFASHPVCGLLSAPRWSGLCRDVAEGTRGTAPAPSPNSSSTAQRPMRTHPAPRVPGGDSVTASVSQRSSGGVPAHSVPPQPPTPQTLPPAGLKFPPGDAGAGRKRVPWVGWC